MTPAEPDFIYEGDGEIHFSNIDVELSHTQSMVRELKARCAELEAEKREVAMCHLVKQTEHYELVDAHTALKAAARALSSEIYKEQLHFESHAALEELLGES